MHHILIGDTKETFDNDIDRMLSGARSPSHPVISDQDTESGAISDDHHIDQPSEMETLSLENITWNENPLPEDLSENDKIYNSDWTFQGASLWINSEDGRDYIQQVPLDGRKVSDAKVHIFIAKEGISSEYNKKKANKDKWKEVTLTGEDGNQINVLIDIEDFLKIKDFKDLYLWRLLWISIGLNLQTADQPTDSDRTQ